MKNTSIVKRIMGIVVVALLSSWVVVSAAPIVFEPEECITRCFFIAGYPVFCYDICF